MIYPMGSASRAETSTRCAIRLKYEDLPVDRYRLGDAIPLNASFCIPALVCAI
jgi:hypothetical protein